MKKCIILSFLFIVYNAINAQIFQELKLKGFYISPSIGKIYDPIIRNHEYFGSEGQEIAILTSKTCWNVRGGWEYLEKNWGVGFGLSCWGKTKLDDFLDYSDPTYSSYYFDLTLHVIPITIKSISLGVYTFIGMGSRHTSYKQDNIKRTSSEFMYCYGVGSRIFILKWLSLFAEYRWVPGDASTPLTPTGGGWYVQSGPSVTENTTKILSFGIITNISNIPGIKKNDNKKSTKN